MNAGSGDSRGATKRLRFRIVDEHGDTVRDFDRCPARPDRLPASAPRAAERRELDRARASGRGGSYRVFADFLHDDKQTTLARDLRGDGNADLDALRETQAVATSDLGDGVRVARRRGVTRASRTT